MSRQESNEQRVAAFLQHGSVKWTDLGGSSYTGTPVGYADGNAMLVERSDGHRLLVWLDWLSLDVG